MPKPIIRITIKTSLTPGAYEKLEEKIKDLLEQENIQAEIYDDMTGNITQTRR